MERSLRWRIAQFLEIRWWKRYLSGKDPEEYLRWKREYWQQLLSELHLDISEEAIMLDAGCGPAGIFIALQGCKVTAMDPLLGAYKSLPHFQPERYQQVHFVESALENFSTEERYDVIFCLNAINHVSDIGQAYDVLMRYLKPGGRLVVSIDAHNHRWLKQIFRWLPGDALHPHQYDLEEYTAFLTDRGLTMEQTLLKDKGLIFNYFVQVCSRQSIVNGPPI